jgi:predicted restriction endonuclease
LSQAKLIKKLDKLFSKIVRERAGYRCLKCGTISKYTQTAHVFSRNNRSVRWDLDNGICLCYYCHIMWAHREPVEFTEWIQKKLGRKKWEYLEKKSKEIFKGNSTTIFNNLKDYAGKKM